MYTYDRCRCPCPWCYLFGWMSTSYASRSKQDANQQVRPRIQTFISLICANEFCSIQACNKTKWNCYLKRFGDIEAIWPVLHGEMKQCQVLIFAFDHEECDSLSKKIKAALGTTCFWVHETRRHRRYLSILSVNNSQHPSQLKMHRSWYQYSAVGHNGNANSIALTIHRYTVLFHFDELDFGQEDKHDLGCLVWARCMFRFASSKVAESQPVLGIRIIPNHRSCLHRIPEEGWTLGRHLTCNGAQLVSYTESFGIFHISFAPGSFKRCNCWGLSVRWDSLYYIFSKWFVLQKNFLKFDEDLDLMHKCRIKDVCAQLIPAFDSFTNSLLYLAMNAIDSRNTCC